MFKFSELDYEVQVWVRTKRNQLLRESDWAMVSDAPTDKEAWAAYRQMLRDFPTQNVDHLQIESLTRPA